MFLDNDMIPRSMFLLRTLPWFYGLDGNGKYHLNKGIAFVQTPQFFHKSTSSNDEDVLDGSNSIFFQGIQVGRDGWDLCAFAGTNAIFRLLALKSIGGIPYNSVTEDAYVSIKLHKIGYRSIYVKDRLAVGDIPKSVASAMIQRARWVKGSVQMLLNYLNCGGKFLPQTWIREPEPGVERYFTHHREAFIRQRNFFRIIFFMDTLVYPFSSLTAMAYIIISFIFLLSEKAPVSFLHKPFDGYWALAFTFVPYLVSRFLVIYVSHNRVQAKHIWIAQQAWFGYAFASLYGIIDALHADITGTNLANWKATADGVRTGTLEWFNVVVVLSLVGCTVLQFAMFLNNSTDRAILAAMFFSVTIIIQLWPMVSMTLYETIYNNNLKDVLKQNLKRIEIPNYVIYTAAIIVGILFSEYAPI